MANKTVLSERQVKSRAAFLGLSVLAVNEKAGFGSNYIYRLWGKDTVTLETVNRIAEVLGCNVCDLLEEVQVDERVEYPKAVALVGVAV
jgi:DNA-binding Xre family transcriptional regulator